MPRTARQAAKPARQAPPRLARARRPERRVAVAAARPRTAPARIARPTPRVVAAVPLAGPPPQAGYEGFRPYGSQPYGYRPYGYGPGYGPGYADERLERLRAAEAAGYIVVRRRSVEFPDGRTLRTYRPMEDGPF